MSRGLILAVVVYALSASGLAAVEPAPVSLDVAVQTGLVEVEVTGRGACSGDSVRVVVRRKVSHEVRVVVVSGTVMEKTDGNVQSMVCHGVKYQKAGDKYRRVDVMVLNDDVPQTFLLEAFCRDFSKRTPAAADSFCLGTDRCQTTSVIVKGKANGAGTKAIQIAVWRQRGETEQEVRRRFRATDAEFTAANKLIEAANPSERGGTVAERRTTESLGIDVGGLIDGIRERRGALPCRKGDTVVVTSDSAPIRVRERNVGTAKKGETFEVLAVFSRGVNVEFVPGEGKPSEHGWIALEHVRLADGAPRGEGRPVIRQLGELVSESQLEVITMSERGY